MTFRLTYEIAHEQHQPGQADRVVRIDLDMEPASSMETVDAVNAWLTAVSGERETLSRDTMAVEGEDG